MSLLTLVSFMTKVITKTIRRANKVVAIINL